MLTFLRSTYYACATVYDVYAFVGGVLLCPYTTGQRGYFDSRVYTCYWDWNPWTLIGLCLRPLVWYWEYLRVWELPFCHPDAIITIASLKKYVVVILYILFGVNWKNISFIQLFHHNLIVISIQPNSYFYYDCGNSLPETCRCASSVEFILCLIWRHISGQSHIRHSFYLQ